MSSADSVVVPRPDPGFPKAKEVRGIDVAFPVVVEIGKRLDVVDRLGPIPTEAGLLALLDIARFDLILQSCDHLLHRGFQARVLPSAGGGKSGVIPGGHESLTRKDRLHEDVLHFGGLARVRLRLAEWRQGAGQRRQKHGYAERPKGFTYLDHGFWFPVLGG